MALNKNSINHKETTFYVCLRFGVYTVILLGLALALPVFSASWDFAGSTDGSTLEWAQFLIIFGTALTLLFAALSFRDYRPLFALLAVVAGIASVREMDYLFKQLIPGAGWWLPAGLLAAAAITIAWRNATALRQQSPAFLAHRSFVLFWAGFIIAALFAQLIGHAPFLEAALGDKYRRSHKRLIEEVSEVLGYLLILAGTIELILKAREVTATAHSCAHTRSIG